MKFKTGSLYRYYIERRVYDDYGSMIGLVQENEPFIALSNTTEKLKWCETIKILTLNGVIGWVQFGYPEKICEFEND